MTLNNETEGVIKYQLHHTVNKLPDYSCINTINAWRKILIKLNLLGQDQNRYAGYGFGNISQRLNAQEFIITGTQTGHLTNLKTADFCLITQAQPEQNRIYATGETQPSSEALTHASIYAQNPAIQAVMHVHSPEIWRNTHKLQLHFTPAEIPYGSVEMADVVTELFNQHIQQPTAIFSLLGHEDGIIACASTLADAGDLLIQKLAKTLEI